MLARVYGCGFPGVVSALGLCERGCNVVALDIDSARIQQLSSGQFWGGDQDLDTYISKHIDHRLKFTSQEPQQRCDFCVISLPTPFIDNRLNIEIVTEACLRILKQFHSHEKPPIIIRSTLPLGGLEAIEKSVSTQLSLESGDDWQVVYMPEFMRQGTGLDDWRQPPLELIGLNHGALSAEIVDLFFGSTGRLVTAGEAEAVKLFSNAFHAMKVSFANEVERICSKNSISANRVMEAFCKDEKLNISTAYLKPGFPWGGGCLGKDLDYLIAQEGSAKLLSGVRESNELHIDHVLTRVITSGYKKVGFHSLSFKDSILDFRESPIIELIFRLQKIESITEIQIWDGNTEARKLALGFSKKVQFIDRAEDLKSMDVVFYRRTGSVDLPALSQKQMNMVRI